MARLQRAKSNLKFRAASVMRLLRVHMGCGVTLERESGPSGMIRDRSGRLPHENWQQAGWIGVALAVLAWPDAIDDHRAGVPDRDARLVYQRQFVMEDPTCRHGTLIIGSSRQVLAPT